jgi:hypothetical protein
VNATEVCKSASDSAAQQCDYATQQSDVDELMRSAPQDEAQPVHLTAAVAPMCAKLRQLLMCRARVFDGSGCVDSGIGRHGETFVRGNYDPDLLRGRAHAASGPTVPILVRLTLGTYGQQK